MSSQVLHVEKWTVGFCTPGRPDSLELRADEYGSIIVDTWSNGGSHRAERRNLHLASVTGKQRNEQVMSKQEGSRSAERDLLFFRLAAMAGAIGANNPLCLASQARRL